MTRHLRTTSLALAGLLTFGLAACGDDTTPDPVDDMMDENMDDMDDDVDEDMGDDG